MEERLDALRSEALHHGLVHGDGVRPVGAPFPMAPRGGAEASASTGYYGLPLLKRPTWTWEVPTYFFVGGAAGASALVGAVARATGADQALVRDARWVAAVGGALSGGLLTSDLGRPDRFLHMLRVFKLQSPMSVGAWTLTAFSTAAGAAAFADVVQRQTEGRVPVAIVANAAEMLAAGTGLVMATYTGVLIGVSAIPVWNHHARLLPMHFAASALASSVSILELLGHEEPALNRLAIVAASFETAAGLMIESDAAECTLPLKRGGSGWVTRAGGVLSGPVPLLLRLAARRSPVLRRAAAVATLTGSLLTRFAWWSAGSASADDPRTPLQLAPGTARSELNR